MKQFSNGQRVVTVNGYAAAYIGPDPQSSPFERHWILIGARTEPTIILDENLFSVREYEERKLVDFPSESLVRELVRRGCIMEEVTNE